MSTNTDPVATPSTDLSVAVPAKRGPRNGHPQVGGLVPEGTIPSKRCSAHRSNGLPCKRWAVVGGTVCTTHGAGAPQVREAARRRILEFAPAAIRELKAIALDPEAPTAARVRALTDLLDRAGLKSPEEHVVVPQVETHADLDSRLLDLMRDRALGTPGPDIIDVEAVD